MYKSLLNMIVLVALLSSCSNTPPHISVVCEENSVGNCIIKWETVPSLKGNVKVYASTDPNFIPEDVPVAMANAADQKMTIITDDPTRRYFYTLVFADKYHVRVATRNVRIPGVQNFRDLGGYPSYPAKKQVRWGMIYRSARIDSLERNARKEVKNMGIRTIIDLRTAEEMLPHPLQAGRINIVHIPIPTGSKRDILKKIKRQEIKNDTIYPMVLQMNRDLIKNYTAEYRRIFHILLDKSSYPVVIHCNSGKERTGIVSALILTALGVDEDHIMEDYQLSNTYFNIPSNTKYAYQLPVGAQEAITTLFSARESFLEAARQEAEREYGDMQTYIEQGIGLTQEELRRLRSILLTDNKIQ